MRRKRKKQRACKRGTVEILHRRLWPIALVLIVVGGEITFLVEKISGIKNKLLVYIRSLFF